MAATSPRRSGRARASVSRYAPESAPKAVPAPRKAAARKPAGKASAPTKAAASKKKASKATKNVDGVLTYVNSADMNGLDLHWSEAKGSPGLTLRGHESLKEAMDMLCTLDKVKVVGKIKFEDIDGEPFDDETTLDEAMGDEEGWVGVKFK